MILQKSKTQKPKLIVLMLKFAWDNDTMKNEKQRYKDTPLIVRQ